MEETELKFMKTLAETVLRVAKSEGWSGTDLSVLLAELALKAAKELEKKTE